MHACTAWIDAIHAPDDLHTADPIRVVGDLHAILVHGAGLDRHAVVPPCMATHGASTGNTHGIGTEPFTQAVEPECAVITCGGMALQATLDRSHAPQAARHHVHLFDAMSKRKILQGRQHERTHGIP